MVWPAQQGVFVFPQRVVGEKVNLFDLIAFGYEIDNPRYRVTVGVELRDQRNARHRFDARGSEPSKIVERDLDAAARPIMELFCIDMFEIGENEIEKRKLWEMLFQLRQRQVSTAV